MVKVILVIWSIYNFWCIFQSPSIDLESILKGLDFSKYFFLTNFFFFVFWALKQYVLFILLKNLFQHTYPNQIISLFKNG